MPKSERPRERLTRFGEQVLSTPELLSIAIKNGTKGENALRLAERLLVTFGGLPGLTQASITELTNIKGIGPEKAARIRASIELGRRLSTTTREERLKITSPSEAALFLMPEMSKLEEEHLNAILLDTRNGVLGVHTTPIKYFNISSVRVRDIFRPAIKANAAAFILAHNHLSDSADPSQSDIRLAKAFIEAGELFNISIIDHIIIAKQKYVSLKERGGIFDMG